MANEQPLERMESTIYLTSTKPFAFIVIFLSGLFVILFGAILAKGTDHGGVVMCLFFIGAASLGILKMLSVLMKPTRKLKIFLELAEGVGTVQTWSDDILEQRVELGGEARTPFDFRINSFTTPRQRSKVYYQLILQYGNPEEQAVLETLTDQTKANALLQALRQAYGKS